jgi:Domain of unknown function(DUF2779)
VLPSGIIAHGSFGVAWPSPPSGIAAGPYCRIRWRRGSGRRGYRRVSHQEFLAEGDLDPRQQFAESLIAALKGAKWPIIVYSSYEQTRVMELARAFPDLRGAIAAIIRRLSDLPVVRSALYHPAFDFSNSIKNVAPALCPDITYDDLDDIADGTAASTAFWLMASGRTDVKTTVRLRHSLRAYCQRDTWAMVRLHQTLNRLVIGSN